LRGFVWMTLQTMFGFLMSPSDVHFIFPWQMTGWCEQTGLRIDRHLGLFHDWGWGAWCAADMKQRVGYALRDQRKADAVWERVSVDLERMRQYLDDQSQFFERLLTGPDSGRLQQVPVDFLPRPLTLREEWAGTELGAAVTDYLADASVRYAAEWPLNALGATSLYFCRPTS
jgi:hypothetical protein